MQATAGKFGLATAVFMVLFGVGAPTVQAATYTYANSISTPAGVIRDSGFRASVSGGNSTALLGLGQNVIVSYFAYPGYKEVGYASGDNPHVTYLFHARYSSLQSKCYWWYEGVGGNAPLTCSVYS